MEKLVVGVGVGAGKAAAGRLWCRGRGAEVGRGCWMQKAGEAGTRRVEDSEVSDCIYIKVLLR